ncbi:hypothetical protein [uncultured Bacteroides sp.]|uniref:hypothetical protein n=1 Tax=uncultured Bacteroides sp. TaxID=162156 RepID=UPI0023BF1EA0|nr:hypothetical protein [uncultured Bacteroides sp.]MDE5759721.1 hypothetical protein [Bacteroides sp.]
MSRFKISCRTGVLIVLALIVGTSCNHRSKVNTESATYEDVEEMAWVDNIVRAIADRDSTAFATLCHYPIYRTYPLHDIVDSTEMVRYFTTIVDDSLRNAITASTPEDWELAGWRGATVYSGEYLWCDPAVYAIPYQSAREKTLLDSLVRADLATLPDSLASGWRPEDCMMDSLSGTIYRIDMRDWDDFECRAMVYKSNEKLLGVPDQILYGKLEIQGTMATQVYTFDLPDGAEMSILFSWYEDSRMLYIEKEGKEVVSRPLKKAYWLDWAEQDK